MTDPTIHCPDCGARVPLTESLAGPLVARVRDEAEAAQRAALAKQKAAIEQAAREAAERAQAAQIEMLRETHAAREAEVAAMREKDRAREAKLAEAQKAQAEALARAEALAERERELDLTVQRRVAEATEAARRKLEEQAQALAAEKLLAEQEKASMRLAEKDEQMAILRRQIETLQRKVEQGSQQIQGEVAELLLEDVLGRAFPTDRVEPVPKGMRGADCVLRVEGAGAILWESKRTANWSPGWLPKLREDGRTAGADLCVLVSEVRPEGCETFAFLDGVWVAHPRFAVPLAAALRDGLLRVAEARGAREGQATKTEMVYDYLTGPQFRARIEAVVEPFEAMQDALRKEKKHMTQQWALRERQMEKAVGAMMGMYGDVRGIAGSAVAEIGGLETMLLEEE